MLTGVKGKADMLNWILSNYDDLYFKCGGAAGSGDLLDEIHNVEDTVTASSRSECVFRRDVKYVRKNRVVTGVMGVLGEKSCVPFLFQVRY